MFVDDVCVDCGVLMCVDVVCEVLRMLMSVCVGVCWMLCFDVC